MNVLEVSVEMAIMISVVLVFRTAVYYQFKKICFVVLWIAITVRLLLPVFLTGALIPQQYNAVSTIRDAFSDAVLPMISLGLMKVIKTLWLLISIALFAIFLLLNMRTKQNLLNATAFNSPLISEIIQKNASPRKIAILKSSTVTAPMTFGVIHPLIVLPKEVDCLEPIRLTYILTHEYIHIRRWDALMKWLVLASVCLHWFNPFVWVLKTYFERDLEASCDEAVITQLGEQHRADYAKTIISAQMSINGLKVGASYLGKLSVEERVLSLARKNKKHTFASLIIVAVLVAIILISFIKSDTVSNQVPGTRQHGVVDEYDIEAYPNVVDYAEDFPVSSVPSNSNYSITRVP